MASSEMARLSHSVSIVHESFTITPWSSDMWAEILKQTAKKVVPVLATIVVTVILEKLVEKK
jgi:hypothetical protein